MKARHTYTNLLSHTKTYYYGVEAIMLGALKTLCWEVLVLHFFLLFIKRNKSGDYHIKKRERENECMLSPTSRLHTLYVMVHTTIMSAIILAVHLQGTNCSCDVGSLGIRH